jgi:ABC-type nitrate/sulfonate/bicarbonate transport system permease component
MTQMNGRVEPETVAAVADRRDSAASRVGRAGQGLIIPLTFLLLWEICARAGMLADHFVPPSVILASFAHMAFVTGELWIHIADSMFRSFSGFLLGSFLGITMGLLAGVSRSVGTFYDPLISLTFPMPKIAILPILMVWLGLGDASKIATIMISVFFPTFINAYYGAKSVNRIYIWSAKNMGAGPVAIFFRVVLPAALPHVLTGARIGLALSFILMFATEMVASKNGLGYLILQAEDFMRFDIMFVAIISIGIVGFASDRVLLAIRRRLLVGQLLSKG